MDYRDKYVCRYIYVWNVYLCMEYVCVYVNSDQIACSTELRHFQITTNHDWRRGDIFLLYLRPQSDLSIYHHLVSKELLIKIIENLKGENTLVEKQINFARCESVQYSHYYFCKMNRNQ